jgi:serine protease Do
MKAKTTVAIVLLGLMAFMGFPALHAQQPVPPPGPRTLGLLNGHAEAWLGVELADVTPAKAQALKLPGDYGAIVTHVEENSPAAKAGLKENDVILEFGGMRVWSVAQLRNLVSETPAGRTVTLRVSRDGRELNLQAQLAQSSESYFSRFFPGGTFHIPQINIPRNWYFDFGFGGMRGRLGIEADDLTPQLAAYFGVKQGHGVLVAQVEPGSPAEKAGLKAGDCILTVGSRTVDSVNALRRELAEQSRDHSVLVLSIVRGGHEQTMKVNVAPPSIPTPMQQARNGTPRPDGWS